MKKVVLVAIAVICIGVFSFIRPKDEFKETYLAYCDLVEQTSQKIQLGDDTTILIKILGDEANKLLKWKDRLAEESANKWGSFEEADWPVPPKNWRCHLDCVYREFLCKKVWGEDGLHCLTRYESCSKDCVK